MDRDIFSFLLIVEILFNVNDFMVCPCTIFGSENKPDKTRERVERNYVSCFGQIFFSSESKKIGDSRFNAFQDKTFEYKDMS